MLTKFASLIAFVRFERFVFKKNTTNYTNADQVASLIAFERFGRFVLKKHHELHEC